MKKPYEPCKRSFEDLRGRHRFGGSDADTEMLVKTIECECGFGPPVEEGVHWQSPVYMIIKNPTQTPYGGEIHD